MPAGVWGESRRKSRQFFYPNGVKLLRKWPLDKGAVNMIQYLPQEKMKNA